MRRELEAWFAVLLFLCTVVGSSGCTRRSRLALEDGGTILAPSAEELSEAAARELLATGDFRRLVRRGPEGTTTILFRAAGDLEQLVGTSLDPLYGTFDTFRENLLKNGLPAFEAVDLTGEAWSSERLQGRTVVLNFWFTGCGPCVAEIPELNRVVSGGQKARDFGCQKRASARRCRDSERRRSGRSRARALVW
jgi:hypothetical protein